MLLGNADDALDEPPVDASSEFDGGAVRAHEHRVTGGDAAALRIRRRDLDVAARTLEAELGHALDGRPGEEGRVALESEACAGWLGGVGRGGGRGRNVGVPRCKWCVGSEVLEREVAVQLGRDFREDSRGVRGDVHVETGCELRDPRELVRTGREHCATEALDAALEIHRRPVALERCRGGQDQVCPAARELVEHREHDDAIRLLGESAHVGIRGRLVAGDDKELDRLWIRLVGVGGDRPAERDSTRVGRRRQVEGAGAGLLRESELVGELGDPCPSASARPRPDHDRPLDRAQFPRESAAARRELAAELGSGSGRGLLGAGRRAHDDFGAVPARLLDPEVDDRRSLDHRVVADHDDDLGLGDAAEREAERLECVGRRLREHRRVRVEADSKKAAERVRELGRLAARERGDDRAARLSEHRLRLVERLVPRDLLEPLATAAERRRDPVLRPEVWVAEAALVAEPALVDLRVVAREDAPDFVLADGHRRVAANGAARADRRDVLDVPGPRIEAIESRRERADRAQLDDVAGERRAVGLVLEGRDLGVGAAIPRDELAVLGDVLREARAAVAEDAALAVERDERRHGDGFVDRVLREGHPRVARTKAEREVLQRALAALVADRAVERVVDEDELERRLLTLRRLRRRRARGDHHARRNRERARGLQLRYPLDLDEAHAAGADRLSKSRLVAEHRDLDAYGLGRLDEARALRHLDLAIVDRDGDELRHARARGRGERASPTARGSPRARTHRRTGSGRGRCGLGTRRGTCRRSSARRSRPSRRAGRGTCQ